MHKIVETDVVNVIPLALASDGTALKPGLEYDQRQKRVVGLIHEVDISYVKEHPVPDPQEIKNNLITGADVTCAISLDNGVTMPVAVHYCPKAVNGEAIFSSMEDEIKTIQTCERCLGHQHSNKHIVTSKASACVSKCEECLSLKSVCLGCSKQGQVSHLTSLRACDACLENGVTCNKLAVLAVSTDCEACNKKALLRISDISESKNLAPELVELELVVPLPDVVHLGKSIRCSWSDWFINLDGEFSNLVLLRTLRDDADVVVRKKLRKLLSLECVRNKDRMVVEPIVRITRPDVLHVLEEVKLVVHKIVPEKYRFWKSNLTGVCPRPIAVCPGPQGSLMVLDYDFDSCISKLLTVRLHQPDDVCITKDNLKDARDLCYVNGVVFIAERGAPAISFVDLTGKVKIKVDSLKRRADLVNLLERFNLNPDGTIPVLRKRLREYLDVISNIEDAENVQVHPSLAKPCALCAVSEDLLLCTDDAQSVIHQLSLEFDGVTISGNSVIVISYPDGILNLTSNRFISWISMHTSRHVHVMEAFIDASLAQM